MQRRSETIGLIVEASRMLHGTVDVLSDQSAARCRDCHQEGGLVENEGGDLEVGFCDSALNIFDETKSAMISGGQGPPPLGAKRCRTPDG